MQQHSPAGIAETHSLPVHTVQVEAHVKIPMRDGAKLDATIWRPTAPGAYPVLVERVAYEIMGRCAADAEYYASRGYVYVGQNVRGSYDSAGDYGWFRDDAWGANQDGYDTIEWAAAQPWSNGKVGMVGGSYSGMTQYLTAPTAPPHLSALFVRYATANVHTLAFRAGAYKLRYTGIVLLHIFEDLLRAVPETPASEEQRQRLTTAAADLAFWQRHLPLRPLPPIEDTPYSHAMYSEPLSHPDDGLYWWPLNMTRQYAAVDVPILHFAGWFDGNLKVMLETFVGIRAHGRSEQCRQGQRLVIGPWIHGKAAGRRAGELDFGPDAEIDLDPFHLRWYDYWLKGLANGVMDDSPVQVFLMGENRWLALADWPPPGIAYTPIYLRQGQGGLGHSLNDGQLSFDPPDPAESADSFTYDPDEPIPSLVGYPDDGPRDYGALESRLLTYTSAPLTQNLVLVGPVKAVIYGSSTAHDTDWVVRLCDVYPEGRSLTVCDGILRARYRNSLECEELLTPGQIYRFEIDLWATAQSFKAGHCLRVQVTSSDFPRYDRNLNTGGPFGEEIQGQVAVNTVFHDAGHASHMVLPVYHWS